jgi:hypothetical protein
MLLWETRKVRNSERVIGPSQMAFAPLSTLGVDVLCYQKTLLAFVLEPRSLAG